LHIALLACTNYCPHTTAATLLNILVISAQAEIQKKAL
jgi:hypothetical protein